MIYCSSYFDLSIYWYSVNQLFIFSWSFVHMFDDYLLTCYWLSIDLVLTFWWSAILPSMYLLLIAYWSSIDVYSVLYLSTFINFKIMHEVVILIYI